jgi:chemotaxis methyl-accepting protein methylase
MLTHYHLAHHSTVFLVTFRYLSYSPLLLFWPYALFVGTISTVTDRLRNYLVRSIEDLYVHHPRVIKVRFLAKAMHRIIRVCQKRIGSEYTRFFRNPPQFEALRHVVMQKEAGSTLRISFFGCSTGAEVYSALWTIRSARPDLRVIAFGLDISSSAVRNAREGIYSSGSIELEGVPDELIKSVFDEQEGGSFKVREWIREGLSWEVGDAGSPDLSLRLGPQDIVMANNFLIHLHDLEAEACLRNIAGLIVPGGYLFGFGIDLDVKTRVIRSLGMLPLRYELENIYNADHAALQAWPQKWWGTEPFDVKRSDREVRYGAVFQMPPVTQCAAEAETFSKTLNLCNAGSRVCLS